MVNELMLNLGSNYTTYSILQSTFQLLFLFAITMITFIKTETDPLKDGGARNGVPLMTIAIGGVAVFLVLIYLSL